MDDKLVESDCVSQQPSVFTHLHLFVELSGTKDRGRHDDQDEDEKLQIWKIYRSQRHDCKLTVWCGGAWQLNVRHLFGLCSNCIQWLYFSNFNEWTKTETQSLKTNSDVSLNPLSGLHPRCQTQAISSIRTLPENYFSHFWEYTHHTWIN